MTTLKDTLPLIGVALGATIQMLGQRLSDGRAARRDKLRTDAESKVRRQTDWLLLQRRTLTEIQDTLEALWSSIATHVAGGKTEKDPLDLSGALIRLTTRLEDRVLADAVMGWFVQVRPLLQGKPPKSAIDEARIAHTGLQDRLGSSLRALHSQSL